MTTQQEIEMTIRAAMLVKTVSELINQKSTTILSMVLVRLAEDADELHKRVKQIEAEEKEKK